MSREAMKQALEALESDPITHAGLVNRKQAIAALRQALEIEQEPVAWVHNVIEGNVVTHIPADIGRHPERWTPLYTAPSKRQWVGLTDEDMEALFLNEDGVRFARYIEAKLKEKNNGRYRNRTTTERTKLKEKNQ